MKYFLPVMMFVVLCCSVRAQDIELNFKTNQYTLSDSAKISLDSFYSTYANDTIYAEYAYAIDINGYADTLGDSAYNQKLSENRAREVYNYLTKNSRKGIPIVLQSDFWSWKFLDCRMQRVYDSVVYTKTFIPIYFSGQGEWIRYDKKDCKAIVGRHHYREICGGIHLRCWLPKNDTTIIDPDWGNMHIYGGSIQNHSARNHKPECDSTFSVKFSAVVIDTGHYADYFRTRYQLSLKLDVVPDWHFAKYCDPYTGSIIHSGYFMLPNVNLQMPVNGDSIIVLRKMGPGYYNPFDTLLTSWDRKNDRFYEADSLSNAGHMNIPFSWLYMGGVYVTKFHKVEKRELKNYLIRVKYKKRQSITYGDRSSKNLQPRVVKETGFFRKQIIYEINAYDKPEDLFIKVKINKAAKVKRLSELEREGDVYIFK
jgi:hypothetical protein